MIVEVTTESELEATFRLAWRAYCQDHPDLPQLVQWYGDWHQTRKWEFDFAFPAHMLAVEMEGAIFSQGRHTRGVGYTQDCVKYNAAQAAGWLVYRMTSLMIDGSATHKIPNIHACLDEIATILRER